MFLGNSQAELEKVIESRLVETFITITILKSPSSDDLPLSSPLTSSPEYRDIVGPLNAEGSSARKTMKDQAKTSFPGKATSAVRREPVVLSRIPSQPPLSHTKSASISVTRVSGEAKRMPLPQSAAESVQSSKNTISTPHYFSPIHRPSTHPRFTIDVNSICHCAEGIDGSGSRLKIEVWGKVGPGRNPELSEKDKAKIVEPRTGWKILQERDFDLRDLVPLPDPFSINSSLLPANSLVITLSHPGGIFYLPPPTSSPRCTLSANDGYASDPELDVWNAREMASFPSVPPGHTENPVLISRRRHRTGGAETPLSSKDDTPATTAGWQDLLKLVTLQSCILDNQSSLSKVVRGIDKMLGLDTTFFQRREVCEYEARLEELAKNHEKVIEDSKNLRNQIQAQMKNFHQRKQMLRFAQEQFQQDIEFEFNLTNEVLRQQAQQAALHARFGPTRTTLISILFWIYPIELLSPPDLLYTILDVPLPIPLTPSDPAPPLTLPSHKDVTEDAVATALGYAAQVVQLLSVYLGKSLVYPLMADRDLRALDMRHTLPNLKNLLLTLTDGEGALLGHLRPPDSPLSLASELELVSRPDSPVGPNATTPKTSPTAILEGSTPSASRSSTPTAAADSSKKPRSFIGFSPLTDFLRGRYPSSSRTSMESRPDIAEAQVEGSSATPSVSENSSDDEDRKTISGTSCGTRVREADFSPGDTQAEKLGSLSPVHSTPPLPVHQPNGSL
ncbi:hypothetical protein C0992_000864 [Termitomyces sp. T32_za158]|nr:hypothetical protein C0992_000864 [Termitomyces sp. T32_za158]